MIYPNRFGSNEIITESALDSDERDNLHDSDFGLPDKRKYPLTDEVHVLQAVRFFKDCPEDDRQELAVNIVNKAKEFGLAWERWNVLKQYLPRSFAESASTNELIPVKHFPYGKVYFGSPIDFDTGEISVRNSVLFVTPYIGIASIFTTDKRRYNTPRGSYNIGYEEWLKPVDELYKPLNEIHVIIEGDPDHPTEQFESHGYIYEIDVNDIKDSIFRYPWMDPEREFLICGLDYVKYSKKIPHSMLCHVTGGPSKTTIQTESAYKNDQIERINDKGESVPEKCDKCGSDIGVFLQGEPVWLCENKDCKKYFGTVPYNISEYYKIDKNIKPEDEVVLACQDLTKAWSKFKYGIPIDGKVQNVPSVEYFNQHYQFLSPDEFERVGGGVCWDYVEWGVKFLRDRGVKCEQYYIYTDTKDEDTHTIILCKSGGRWIYPEGAFKLVADEIDGVAVFDDIKEVFEFIVPRMFEMNDNKRNYKSIDYYVWNYKGHPQYGCDYREYMEYVTQGEPFLEGTVTYESEVVQEIFGFGGNTAVDKNELKKNRNANLEALDYDSSDNTIEIKIKGKPTRVKVVISASDKNGADRATFFGMKKAIYANIDNEGVPYIRIPPRYLCKPSNMLLPLVEHEAEHVRQFTEQKRKSGDTIPHVDPRDDESILRYTREFIKKHEKGLNDHDSLEYELLADFHAAMKYGRKGYMKALRGVGEYGLSLKRLKKEITSYYDALDPQLKLYRRGIKSVAEYIKVTEEYISQCKHVKQNCDKIQELAKKNKTTSYEITRPGMFGGRIKEYVNSEMLYGNFSQQLELEIENQEKILGDLKKMKTNQVPKEFLNNFKAKNTLVKIISSIPALLISMGKAIISTELRGKFIKQIMKDKPWINKVTGTPYKESHIPDEFTSFDIESSFIAEFGIEKFNDLMLFIEDGESLSYDEELNKEVNKMFPDRFNRFGEQSTIFKEAEEPDKDEADETENTDTDEDAGEEDTLSDEDTGEDTLRNDDGTEEKNVNLDSFGTDTDGTTPNNEYDENEIQTLNSLIADENKAVGMYFDGAKNTKNPLLARIYADIGGEERFHAEQLMYAKSVITGEKYEPQDPDVKREYEELVNMGMDEETAMATAIDKTNLGEDADSAEEMQEIEEDVATIESAIDAQISSNEMMLLICESKSFSPTEMSRSIDIFMESSTIYMEDVQNVNQVKQGGSKNPISLILRGIIAIGRLIGNLLSKFKYFIRRIGIKTANKMAWIKKNGIKSLFAKGIYMYFYDPAKPGDMSSDPIRYIELMTNVTMMIARQFNMGNLIQMGNFRSMYNGTPIPCKNLDEGLSNLKGIVLNKSKIVITNSNQEGITNDFFKITDAKDMGGQSYNVYNDYVRISSILQHYSKNVTDFINALQKMESTPGSPYYTNRAGYDKAMSALSVVQKSYQNFAKALSSDINTMIKLNNDLYAKMKEADGKTEVNNNNGQKPTQIPENILEAINKIIESDRNDIEHLIKNKAEYNSKNRIIVNKINGIVDQNGDIIIAIHGYDAHDDEKTNKPSYIKLSIKEQQRMILRQYTGLVFKTDMIERMYDNIRAKIPVR